MQNKHSRQLLLPMAQTPPDSDTCPHPNWESGPSCSQEVVRLWEHSQDPNLRPTRRLLHTGDATHPVTASWGPDS